MFGLGSDKNCHILSQNVKYGTFVANVTKNLTYVLWGNISGSNLRRESSASCEGLGYFVTNSRTFWCPFTGLWGMPMTYYVILKFFSPGAATVQAALEFMTPGGSLSPFKIASSFLFSIAFISTVFKTFLSLKSVFHSACSKHLSYHLAIFPEFYLAFRWPGNIYNQLIGQSYAYM